MFKVLCGAEITPGVWAYSVEGTPIAGRSRQPLLDACREIQRTSGSTLSAAGLFRKGRSTPDLICPVNVGADFTVNEAGPRFRKFEPFPGLE